MDDNLVPCVEWQEREGFSLITKETSKTYMLGAYVGTQIIKLRLMVYS